MYMLKDNSDLLWQCKPTTAHLFYLLQKYKNKNLLEPSYKDFEAYNSAYNLITLLHEVKENILEMDEGIGILSRQIDTMKGSQMYILGLKSTVSEILKSHWMGLIAEWRW